MYLYLPIRAKLRLSKKPANKRYLKLFGCLRATHPEGSKLLPPAPSSIGFSLSRISGSHHIFTHPDIAEIVNLQNKKGKAIGYQVQQFLTLVEQYSLTMESDEK
jgi:hypothetical protein